MGKEQDTLGVYRLALDPGKANEISHKIVDQLPENEATADTLIAALILAATTVASEQAKSEDIAIINSECFERTCIILHVLEDLLAKKLANPEVKEALEKKEAERLKAKTSSKETAINLH